jgi:hypothetical protein
MHIDVDTQRKYGGGGSKRQFKPIGFDPVDC